MKRLIIVLVVCCVALVGCGGSNNQYTAIPDQNFEQALIDLGYDGVIDGKVLTKSISSIDSLDLTQGFGGKNISELSGIEAFTALTYLSCFMNKLTTLDVSKNTALTSLNCYGNQLTSLDVSKNTALTELNCGSNQLTSLDLSQNTALTSLDCSYNNLITLNLKNGNNRNINYFKAEINIGLWCIEIDDDPLFWASKKLNNNLDTNYSYSNNCNYHEYYFTLGDLKFAGKDYKGAIADFTKAIELSPSFAAAYFQRGASNFLLKDFKTAIADFTKAIEFNPDASAYFQRGASKFFLKDYYGAIDDHTQAIELSPSFALAYLHRGVANQSLGKPYCSDYKKACDLGDNEACQYHKKLCE